MGPRHLGLVRVNCPVYRWGTHPRFSWRPRAGPHVAGRIQGECRSPPETPTPRPPTMGLVHSRNLYRFAVLFVMDALPQPDSWHDAQGNLGLDSTPGPINPTFYPYLVSPTQYPQPDTYPLPRYNCHYCPPVALSNWTFPQVSSAVINQVPAFLVVASEVFPTFSSFSFQTFNYNASLAAGIANGTATFNVPLTPSSGSSDSRIPRAQSPATCSQPRLPERRWSPRTPSEARRMSTTP